MILTKICVIPTAVTVSARGPTAPTSTPAESAGAITPLTDAKSWQGLSPTDMEVPVATRDPAATPVGAAMREATGIDATDTARAVPGGEDPKAPQRGPTPVLLEVLINYLQGYNPEEVDYLVTGFREGFRIPATDFKTNINVCNHPSALTNEYVVTNIIDKEVKLGRVAGPFHIPPFKEFHVSPLGLIPKGNGSEFRLIHNLSYPRDESVNAAIDRSHTAVRYESLDECIEWILHFGRGCLVAKADFKDAYRMIPLHPESVH